MFQKRGCKTMLTIFTRPFPNKLMSLQKKRRLTIQCDEMWSFVGNKGNKQWIWLALDVETREIVDVSRGRLALKKEQSSFGLSCQGSIVSVR